MEGLKGLDDVAYVRFASVYKNFREAKDFEEMLGELGRARTGAAAADAVARARRLPGAHERRRVRRHAGRDHGADERFMRARPGARRSAISA